VARRRSLGALQEHKHLQSSPSSPQDRLQAQLQTFLDQRKYPQAIDKIKQIKKSHPEISLKITEAEIWLLQGQQDYKQKNYRQAEKSFRQALEQGLNGESHYWLAKCLLALDQLDAALEIIKTAFEHKKLSKDYAGCYLKLLFLKGETATVTDLITRQSKQFYAPQLHWARGILALQDHHFEDAIAHFQKMGGRNATPEDVSRVWSIYTQQQSGQWDAAETLLGLKYLNFMKPNERPAFLKHPALQRLFLIQAFTQKRSLVETVDLPPSDDPQHPLFLGLQLLHQLEQSDFYNAAYLIQALGHPCPIFPELDGLWRTVLLLAGEQALQEQEPEDAAEFWEQIVYQPPFDPKLALKLHLVYRQIDDDVFQPHQRLLNHLQDWLKKEARDNPQAWPENQLTLVQAKFQCWVADLWMSIGQERKANKLIQDAAKFRPDSPEVIGRQGLIACIEGNQKEAIPLLTKALEGGCHYDEAYEALISTLEEQGNSKAAKEMRRRFGATFGDLSPDQEVDLPRWIEALSTRNYFVFEELVMSNPGDRDPALQACRFFVRSADGQPNTGGKVGLQLDKTKKEWDKLLRALPAQAQIPVLQSILLTLQLFAKRQKGLADCQSQYHQQLTGLIGQYPEAQVANLVFLVVKALAPDRLRAELSLYLAKSPQPGTALAQIQLQARRFTQTAALRPLIDEALQREPQNPQLLLAKATTFPLESPHYKQLQEQGFELARRVQDAQALQAFREEEAFQAGMMAGQLFPDLMNSFTKSGQLDVTDMMRKMAQKMLGDQISPDELEVILPELIRMASADMPDLDFGFDDGDDFFSFGPPNFFERDPFGGGRSSAPRKPARRRRRS
jgi:tetratricopeptide (TPR) repeat protein